MWQTGAGVHGQTSPFLRLEPGGALADGAGYRIAQHPLQRLVQPVQRVVGQFSCRGVGRQPGSMQHFVGVGVTNSGDHRLVGQRRFKPLGAPTEHLCEPVTGQRQSVRADPGDPR